MGKMCFHFLQSLLHTLLRIEHPQTQDKTPNNWRLYTFRQDCNLGQLITYQSQDYADLSMQLPG